MMDSTESAALVKSEQAASAMATIELIDAVVRKTRFTSQLLHRPVDAGQHMTIDSVADMPKNMRPWVKNHCVDAVLNLLHRRVLVTHPTQQADNGFVID